MEQRFELAQVVGLRADKGRSGPVIEVWPPTGDMPRYRVYHGPGDIWVYD